MSENRNLVSVITPAYNALPCIERCVESVAHQSFGPGPTEMIVVDDGSTDGTSAVLDRLAAEHPTLLRVIHQENSGSPSGPRNLGLDLASGRYVFFLDADDYLAPEALQRLTTAAEVNESDVVLGRMASRGRRVPRSMFRANQADADLFTSRVYWALSAQKLFRKELLDRLQLRFDTGLRIGEDQPFTALAYLRARRISVVADYDCYYLVRRPDGRHLTATGSTEPVLDALHRVCELLRTELPPGQQRDALLERHFAVELRDVFRFLGRETDPAVQQHEFARVQRLLARHEHDSFWHRLAPVQRLRCHLARHGHLGELLSHTLSADAHMPFSVHISRGRALAQYPPRGEPGELTGRGEREGRREHEEHREHREHGEHGEHGTDGPAACFDVTDRLALNHHVSHFSCTGTRLRLTGRARLEQAGPADRQTAEVFLQHRHEPWRRHARTRLAGEFFEADLDLLGGPGGDGGPPADGCWDLYLSLTVNGLVRTVRLGSRRDQDAGRCPFTYLADDGEGGIRTVRLYATAYGNLTLRLEHVPAARLSAELRLDVEAPVWCGPVLRLHGTTNLITPPTGSVLVQLASRSGAADFPLVIEDDGRFSVELPLDVLSSGRWAAALRIAAANWQHTRPLRQPVLPGGGARWRRSLVPRYAKPVAGDPLTLRVDRVRPARGLRRRLAQPTALPAGPSGHRAEGAGPSGQEAA
ncbi:glycosyltransferase family 2 protein [Streptomyces qinglanensis]|uniref:CDP-glycerol glycerophosphotransferase n=1 Tax=Streptomyces qinglanensis TaxID=943816 RepID=A0A1H9WGJ7_9ACTN|nr:glycosyltransferase family A protein [Streptomyces qinglanensis]SES33020.1 CDP-glycerol glycerophosphotransferase [Streptomyces qinglanensis]